MNKQEKKKLKKEFREKELKTFRQNLPMSESLFPKLFEYLTDTLDTADCNHDLTYTLSFLEKNKIQNIDVVVSFLEDNGGYCDCEVLYNVTECFDYLENTWDNEDDFEFSKTDKQIFEKKRKINSLRTDFGFAIDKVPQPWKLKESLESKTPKYYFQIGKGMNICLVSLEKDYNLSDWDNDNYFLNKWNEGKPVTNPEKFIIERLDWENYRLVVVKFQSSIRINIWCFPKETTTWHFEISTEIQRWKGDLKELEKLLKNIDESEF